MTDTETTDRVRDDRGYTPKQALRHDVREAVNAAMADLRDVGDVLAGREGLSEAQIQENFGRALGVIESAQARLEEATTPLRDLVSTFPDQNDSENDSEMV